MKFQIHTYKNINSSNDKAIKLIKKGNFHFGCVVADSQKKGKGTRGKIWISKKGNLFISLFFPLKEKYPAFNEFSIINPVIVSNLIMKYCEKDEVKLKFPNDILLNGKKVSGILQEVITINNKKFLIVGIGVNINSSPKITKKYEATNIYFETKKKINRQKMIKHIISSYEKFLGNLSVYKFKNFKKRVEKLAVS